MNLNEVGGTQYEDVVDIVLSDLSDVHNVVFLILSRATRPEWRQLFRTMVYSDQSQRL